jgi:predicted anti-sigma-YlaC factor YlaD
VTDHRSAREALGSYLLGALDPPERVEVAAHLAGCASCREELASLAPLPGLMGRLSAEEVQSDLLAPPPALLPTVLAAVEAERVAGRHRLRRWRAAALGAASLIVAAGAAGVLVLAGSGNPVSGIRSPAVSALERPLVAPDGLAATGVASLESRSWGTQVHLVLRNLPRQGSFTAWAVDARGARRPAATWRATADGHVDVTGAAALRPGELIRLQVSSDDGTAVLSTAT